MDAATLGRPSGTVEFEEDKRDEDYLPELVTSWSDPSPFLCDLQTARKRSTTSGH